ncbi:serine hydrolase [Thioalkalivibrio sp. XN8]|uniref:serine hydrolase n=1 Tax=Thioalkalivibrio sp. XN8 TaxID=2712863 RepID=UPI0013EC9F9A|nr:serine hydrolase [Thioalkalivibrio sp. XN8]NGP54448.1 serine hydrolase [Thioalkalivibrio sp. XN8]
MNRLRGAFVIVSCLLAGMYSSWAEAQSCEAYFPFDDSLVDASGNGFDGRMIGRDGAAATPRFVDGRAGRALALDGTAAMRIFVDLDYDVCPQMSFTAWIRFEGPVRSENQIILTTGGSGPGLRAVGSSLVLNGTANGLSARNAVRGDSGWMFVAGVYDYTDNTYTLHWRNRSVEGTLSQHRRPPEDAVWIGAMNDRLAHAAGGILLDDLRIIGRALSVEELAALRSRGAPDIVSPAGAPRESGTTATTNPIEPGTTIGTPRGAPLSGTGSVSGEGSGRAPIAVSELPEGLGDPDLASGPPGAPLFGIGSASEGGSGRAPITVSPLPEGLGDPDFTTGQPGAPELGYCSPNATLYGNEGYLSVEHEGAGTSLLDAIQQVKTARENITAMQYTSAGEWFLLAGYQSWYSNPSYFDNLKGDGQNGFRAELETLLKNCQKIRSVAIDPAGNWLILMLNGDVVYSSQTFFQSTGLATAIESIRNNQSRATGVYLGPQKSWLLKDMHGRLYSRGLPADLKRLVDSVEESRLTVSNLAFRFTSDGQFHYVLTAGNHFWKSGVPSSPLWKKLNRIQNRQDSFTRVALAPDNRFVAVSQHKWSPSTNDILSRMELNVGGSTIWERMRQQRVPGMSIAIVRNGTIVDVRSYGYRSRTSWAPVNNDTVFNNASISKAVASAGIMKTVEEGRVDLDRPVFNVLNADPSLVTTRKWYRSLTDRQQQFVRQAPFHTLLDHTSGFGVWGIGLSDANTKQTLEDIIFGKKGRQKVEPQWIPQTRRAYSGGAYSVAESIIEETYATSFAHRMQTTVLQPLKMSLSTFGNLSAAAQENYAFGHDENQRLPYRVCVGKAAGGLFSTARDYAKFLATLMGLGVSPDGNRVLSEASVRRMMTPAHTKTSSEKICTANPYCPIIGENCYENRCLWPIMDGDFHSGLGLKLSAARNSIGVPKFVEHGGSQPGYSTRFYADLERNAGFVMLSNGSCKWELVVTGTVAGAAEVEERGGCSLSSEIKTAFDQALGALE